MTWFPLPDKVSKTAISRRDLEMLHTLECQACPLAQLANENPDAPASGCEDPLIYVLGEGPGKEEDEVGKQFIGKSGELLKDELFRSEFKRLRRQIRYNNVIRTRHWGIDPNTGDTVNKPPTPVMVECCRPSIIRDIEASKPKAIFGFGNVPLHWITGYSGINAYRGRRMPVKVGKHSCWYYPFLHPAAILHQSNKRYDFDDGEDDTSSEDHRMFKFDIAKALSEIEGLPDAEVHTGEYALRDIEIITEFTNASLDRIEQQLRMLGSKPAVGLDYETNALRPYGDDGRILTGAVSDGDYALSIPFEHSGADWSRKQLARLENIWIEFLRTAKAVKAVHNLQFEQEWTGVKFGIDLLRAGKWCCTQVEAAILDERSRGTEPGPQSLEFLVLNYFGINIKKLANVDRVRLDDTPLPHVLQYNGLDARYHVLLHRKQRAAIKREGLDYCHELAQRRVPTLVLSQIKGLPVSQEEVRKLNTKYRTRIEETIEAIRNDRSAKAFMKKYGRQFDPGKDCVELFSKMLNRSECWIFDKAKAKKDKRSGKPQNPFMAEMSRKLQRSVNRLSADESVLSQLAEDHPLASMVLTLRKAQKRLSTYIEPMLAGSSILWPDGLLHPVYTHTFAETSRLSAEAPNVQNYPKRDEEAKEVRRPVEPQSKDQVVIAIDCGQIEARVIAMYTKDKRYVKYLWEGNDIHGEWAARIAAEIPERVGGKKCLKDKKVMKAFRTDVKNQWTFPLVFGATVVSAAGYLGVDVDALQPLYDQFWDEYDGIKGWQEELKRFYDKYGYVETFTGRRRRGPLSINKVYNSPVQGFTAELVMDCMNRLAETGDPLLHPEVQIHDDLTWMRAPVDKVDYIVEKALDIMLYPPFECINVPLTVEVSVGANWLEMEEIGVFSSNEWRK